MGEYRMFTTEDACEKTADDKQVINNYGNDENSVRGNWTNKTEQLLSMIGFSIGLGNIWRFPYVTYSNGGGAFLIPYFITLVAMGIPLFFLESALGQFSSQSPVNIWRSVPLLKGTGICSLCIGAGLLIYYNVIVAYSLFYMFASIEYPLPWTNCIHWAGDNCTNTTSESCTEISLLVSSNLTEENGTCSDISARTSLSEQYWDQVVLQRSSGLSETGQLIWQMALCLLLSSVLVFAAVCNGVKSSGKAVYFTVPLPYVVLTILLIRGVTLEGAGEGIDFYIGSKSNLTLLADIEVWKNAASQNFYSLSIGFGGVITFSSYSKFNNNLVLDTFVIAFVGVLTSLYAGFCVFSVLGHMAYLYKKPIEDVVTEGFALVFIAYPNALSALPGSNFWSFLFFFMLFTIGLDTLFALLEAITTSLIDGFPNFPNSKRPLLTAGICAACFLLGLPCVTQAGIYWVVLMDSSFASWVPLVAGLVEVLGVIYIYGGSRFIQDIEMMIGPKSWWFWLYWRLCWYFITPCITVTILVLLLLFYTPTSYAAVEFPAWGLALGWCMSLFCILFIPLVAVYKVVTMKGSFRQRLRTVCQPTEDWHPYLDIHRGKRYSKDSLNQS